MKFEGRYAIVEPLDPERHGGDLWRAAGGESHAHLWQWMPDGPFPEREPFDAVLRAKSVSEDPRFFAIVDRASGAAQGHASFMRHEPRHKVIEVALQRTRAATDAMYLMARHVFETMGYRRYEWKCNALNLPSRAGALRLGFTFEGVFRQHMIVKGQNRDTAWFSLLDSEWPARRADFERWLDPSNFDETGRQRTPLRRC
jgi:RimJ/RimL family protein N-acetyltransferase